MSKHYTPEEWQAWRAARLKELQTQNCGHIQDPGQRFGCECTQSQYVPAYPGQWPTWAMIPVVIVFFVVAALILMSAVLGFAA